MNWTSGQIRQTFLDFFQQKGHKIVPSAPMVIKDDPTLMFTNAGMNPFKDFFLGNQKALDTRVADTQKCLRVSGKHNDLEEVGVDTYHHTMFEMLGNWSFGDYFKQEAIAWAWELLTEVYKIDKDRIYITIFGGDDKDGLEADNEALEIWKRYIAVERILPFSKKDNFWEMGDTGPCGPCSEIHVDIRNDADRAKLPGDRLVNQDHPQVIEIWNLVFMQFNRMANGSLQSLPAKHVDTGMGLERLAMVLQGKQSNYDTDVFTQLINKMVKVSGVDYKQTQSKQDVALRVIADHIRAIAFSIADGQLPSNSGAGYVIRRILRRAVRYGYSFLNCKEPFIYALVETLEQQMGSAFPELTSQKELITKVIREEEESFLRTLDRGIVRFNEYKNNNTKIEGDFAFELYDTFGFPIDLTQLMASELGLEVNLPAFQNLLEVQKERSRKATAIEADDWVELLEDDHEEFIGYDYTEADVYITRYRKVNAKGKTLYQLVFNITPFYAESGGQVGDTGYIEAQGERCNIIDTKKENNLIIHLVNALPSKPNARFKAVVNTHKRKSTTQNHSATHLLHEALREVLGKHVEQKGSLVHPDYLRFDFSHFKKVEDEEIERIETLVNEAIRANLNLQERRAIPIAEAKNLGAMALFGEKYGDLVRVIQFGSSIELCGGTHVRATGEIGYFKLTSESSVAAGIRRIEAITGEKAQSYINEQLKLIEELKGLLKNPKSLSKAIESLLDENQKLSKQIEVFEREQEKVSKQNLLKEIADVNGLSVLIAETHLPQNAIKNIAFQLRSEVENLFMVLISTGEKPVITIAFSDNLVKEKQVHAGNLVREWAKEINGGGGGQPFFATAGGSNSKGVAEVFRKAKELVKLI